MEINLLSGALGAEIKGINLKDTSTENWKKINSLMLEHKVVFFRDQDISSDEQIELAKHFGPLEKHVYVKARENYPEILRIIKAPDEKHQWGEGWHTDVSYNPKPTKVIILRSHKIPPVGGDTMFSNMELAYETLDNDIKKKIFKHQERLDFTCRIKWTENAIAIWDNRSLLHQGLSDFFPGRGLGYERVMDRIAIEGDKPE